MQQVARCIHVDIGGHDGARSRNPGESRPTAARRTRTGRNVPHSQNPGYRSQVVDVEALCDSAGISMGRAAVALIDGELTSVFGDHADDAAPAFAHQAEAKLAAREAQLAAREHNVEEIERRQRTRSDSLRRWESELEARERRLELPSKLAAQRCPTAPKMGRHERCPCGSGLKYKRCHGRSGRPPNAVPR